MNTQSIMLVMSVCVSLFCLACGRTPPFTVSVDQFDSEALTRLKPFGEFDAAEHFGNRWAIILYFSELSCDTCSDKAVKFLSEFQQGHEDIADYLLVVHGRDPIYLANLRRVGQVRWPILLEEYRGESGFLKETTTIALLDKQNQSLPMVFNPTPNTTKEEYARFQKELLRHLAEADI